MTPSHCRIVLDNPPLNLMGPKFVLQIREIVTALENDDRVKVVVVESAVDGFFLNHSDFLAIANPRLAYQHYERVFSSPRWTALQAAGASPQRPPWASTSVKDPAYPDTRYVTGLVAPGVVNTMPEATLRAVADHGQVPADPVRGHYAEARQVIEELQDIGIDFGDVMQGLEDDAVTRFDRAGTRGRRGLGGPASRGVDLCCGVQVAEITGASGRADGVRLADGSRVQADAVIVGVGITPNSQLAAQAGRKADNGIVVDAQLRSSDPDIYAAGDVASAYHPRLGQHIRVEHWYNAVHRPQTAAKAMLSQDVAYDRTPYFYTDQYDLGMEYSGYVEPGGYDQVVFRGDVQRREFIAFWLASGRVLAGMNVNTWDVNDKIEALVRSGRTMDAARLADPEVPLEEILAG